MPGISVRRRLIVRPVQNGRPMETVGVGRTTSISLILTARKKETTRRLESILTFDKDLSGRDVYSSYSLPKCHFKGLPFDCFRCRLLSINRSFQLEKCKVSPLLLERNDVQMVTFLKSGSRQLDNSISVGFVQFSTNVTYSEWLPRRWSKDDYLDQMPSSFDAGYTNTPAALDEAGSLFRV